MELSYSEQYLALQAGLRTKHAGPLCLRPALAFLRGHIPTHQRVATQFIYYSRTRFGAKRLNAQFIGWWRAEWAELARHAQNLHLSEVAEQYPESYSFMEKLMTTDLLYSLDYALIWRAQQFNVMFRPEIIAGRGLRSSRLLYVRPPRRVHLIWRWLGFLIRQQIVLRKSVPSGVGVVVHDFLRLEPQVQVLESMRLAIYRELLLKTY